MNAKKIIDKVKKLLSLATSPNENEAKSAATMANEILTKHNLTLQEVNAQREYEQGILVEKKRASIEDKYIVSILNTYFFVTIIKSYRVGKCKFKIFGTEENVAIASYIYSFLHNAFKNCFIEYRKKTGCLTNAKNSYYYGFYNGLCEQLKSKRKEVERNEGLVLVKDTGLKRFVYDEIGKTIEGNSSVITRNSQAVSSGYEKGKELKISRGIESSGNEGKCLA